MYSLLLWINLNYEAIIPSSFHKYLCYFHNFQSKMESTETINVLLDSISFILNRMDCSEAAQFNINIILDYCKIHLNILDNSKKNLLHSRDFSTETFNLESLIEATSSVIRKFNKVNYKNIVQTLIDKIKSQTEVITRFRLQ